MNILFIVPSNIFTFSLENTTSPGWCFHVKKSSVTKPVKSIKTLLPLVKGKKFRAYLTKNDKGYLELTFANIDSIVSLDAPAEQVEGLGEKEVVINTESTENTNKVKPSMNW